jgi:hypothetical protein
MIRVEGKYGISATILADSINEGIRLTTFEITYPRLILSELNTHRMLSKNSASSRAIPFAKMKENLTGRPVRFGQANPGMQDKGEDYDALVRVWCAERPYDGEYVNMSAEEAWKEARDEALTRSQEFHEAGYHKQVYNRLTEPFQMMKTVISGTEWNNFFWLRKHEAADPTIAELARVMWEVREQSTPDLLRTGEWHLPYVRGYRYEDGEWGYDITTESVEDGIPTITVENLTLEQARKVSAARCAAVSFRNVDYGVTKCEEVFARLVGDDRKHASAFEHQATPMHPYVPFLYGPINNPGAPFTWEPGISHVDKKGQLWSGNFRGFVQFRKLIPGENYAG